MGVLYQTDVEDKGSSQTLKEKLQQQVHTSEKDIGKPVFTPIVVYSLMLFVLIYFPCIAAISAIKREANWKWATFTVYYTTFMAWLIAFATYNIGNLFL
jgi:ferrous iron transport protein B